jgi:hypothetical protein
MATLAQFWQQERDTHKAALAATQSGLATAQQDLVDAKTALQVAAAGADKLKTDIAANRAKLAATPVPSEVTALNAMIRDQIIAQRGLQATILDQQDAVASAQADADGAAVALARATSSLANAEARLAAATGADAKRQALKTKLSAAPFDTMKAEATAFAGGQVVTDAKSEIDATFPADLQKIVFKRYATRTKRVVQVRKTLTDAEDALGTALAAKDGLSGDAAKKAVDFRRADQALRDFATSAKQRYDRAVAIMNDLQAIKNGTKTPDLLTAQEKLDIAVSAERTAAEGKAEGIDTKLNDLYTARNALDTQIVTQIDTDVDKLSTDPTLQTKRADVTGAIGTLKTAQDAVVTSGDREVLDLWEVVVQDPTWRALIDYLEAKATLDDLSATTPASFGTALDTAEDAYATALAKVMKAQRQTDSLADVVGVLGKRLDASSNTLPNRVLSAVRGDSF